MTPTNLPFRIYSNLGTSQALSSELPKPLVTPVERNEFAISINSQTGNLTLREPGLNLVLGGSSLPISFHFNSRLTESRWQFSAVRSLRFDETNETSITLMEHDGLPVPFTFSEKRQCYCPPKGYKPSGCELHKTEGGFVMQSPNQDIWEQYDETGRLKAKKAKTGELINFAYDGNGRLIEIESPHQFYQLDWHKSTLLLSDKEGVNLASFEFIDEDYKQLMTTTLFDEESDYQRHYEYQNGNLSACSNERQQVCEFKFSDSGQIETISCASDEHYHFSTKETKTKLYKSAHAESTSVTDSSPLLSLTHNRNGSYQQVAVAETTALLETSKELEPLSIAYSNGRLDEVENNLAGQWVEKRFFEAGKLVHQKKRHYDQDGLLVAESLIELEKNRALTHYFIYQKTNFSRPHLLFEISQRGEVKEYVYKDLDCPAQEICYPNHSYALENNPVTLEALLLWRSKIKPEETLIKDLSYDVQGQLQVTRLGTLNQLTSYNQFGQLLETGFKEDSGEIFKETIRYNKANERLSLIDKNSNQTRIERLALPFNEGVIPKEIEQSLIDFIADNNLIKRIQEGHAEFSFEKTGLISLRAFNQDGREITTLKIEKVNDEYRLLQKTNAYYQGSDKPIATLDENGLVKITIQDQYLRKRYCLNEEGELLAVQYHDNDDLNCELRFTTLFEIDKELPVTLFENIRTDEPIDPNLWIRVQESLNSFIQANEKNARKRYEIKDSFGQLLFDINEEGYCKEHRYNSLNLKISSTHYAKALNEAEINELIKMNAFPSQCQREEEDRTHHTIYHMGQKTHSIDTAGYLTKHQFNQVGQETITTRYHRALAAVTNGILCTEELNKLAQSDPMPCRSRHYYNQSGLNDLSVDAEGYVNLKIFNAQGLCTQTRHFEKQISPPSQESHYRPELPPESSNDKIIHYQYDPHGNLLVEHHPNDGLVVKKTYDFSHRLLTEGRYEGEPSQQVPENLTGDTFRQIRFTRNRLGQITHILTPSLCLKITELEEMQKKASGLNEKIEALTSKAIKKTYQGLQLISEENELGHKTLYCYDKAGRQIASLSAAGVIKRSYYNPFSQEIESRIYQSFVKIKDSAFSPTSFTSIKGQAQLESYLQTLFDRELIKSLAFDADSTYFDLDNHCTIITDPEGYQTYHSHNAFDEETIKRQQVSDNLYLETKTTRETRGLASKQETRQVMLIEQVFQPNKDSLCKTNLYQYHSPFAHCTKKIEEDRAITHYQFDRLGRAIEESLILENGEEVRVSSHEYTAFNQIRTLTDPEGLKTLYQFDRQARCTLTLHPDGSKSKTVQNVFGQEISHCLYRSDADGASEIVPLKNTMSHCALGKLLTHTQVDHNRNVRLIRQNAYDHTGKLSETINAAKVCQQFQRNEDDHLTAIISFDSRLDESEQKAVAKIIKHECLNVYGLPLSTMTAAGRRTNYTYDKRQLTIESALQAECADEGFDPCPHNKKVSLRTSYNGLKQQTRIESGLKTSSALHVTEFKHDSLSRSMTKIIDPGTNDLNIESRVLRDWAGQIVLEQDTEGLLKRTIYDLSGNPLYAISPLGIVTACSYNQKNQLLSHRLLDKPLSQETLETVLSYDSLERLSPEERSAFRALIAKEVKALESSDDKLTSFTYNQRGQKEASIQHFINSDGKHLGLVHRYQYNLLGKVVSKRAYTSPLALGVGELDAKKLSANLLNHALHDSAQDRAIYTIYSDFGEPRFHIDARGKVTESVFDEAGRIIKTTIYAELLPIKNPQSHHLSAALINELQDLKSTLSTYSDHEFKDLLARHGYLNNPQNQSEFFGFTTANKPFYVLDKKGMLTTFSYDKDDRLIESCQHQQEIKVRTLTEPELKALVLEHIAKKDPKKDRISRKSYYNSGELYKLTDPLGYEESFVRNDRGLIDTHIDRAGFKHHKEYDKAGRLIADRSEGLAIYETSLNDDGQTINLSKSEQSESSCAYHYGKGLKANKLVLNLGQTDEKIIWQHYDKEGRDTGTSQECVEVDDENISFNESDVALKNISKPLTKCETVHSEKKGYGAGKEPRMHFNALGEPSFLIYNTLGHALFEIAINGRLTKYERDLHGKILEKKQFARALDTSFKEALATNPNYLRQGFSLTEFLALNCLPEPDEQNDRSLYCQYDNDGNLTELRKSSRPLYHPESNSLTTIEPTIKKRYDAFGRLIYKGELQFPEERDTHGCLRHESQWHESFFTYEAGHKKPSIALESVKESHEDEKKLKLTHYTFNVFGDLTSKHEFATPLSYSFASESSENLLSLIMKLKTNRLRELNQQKDEARNRDRVTHYSYNLRGEQISECLEQEFISHQVHHEKNVFPASVATSNLSLKEQDNGYCAIEPQLVRQDLIKRIERGARGEITKVTHENGESEYFYYDANKKIIAEILRPVMSEKQTGPNQFEAVKVLPVTLYYRNASGEEVGQKKLNAGLSLITELPKQHEAQNMLDFSLPSKTSEQDAFTLQILDNRGLAKLCQNRYGDLQTFSYYKDKTLARKAFLRYHRLPESMDLKSLSDLETICKSTQENRSQKETRKVQSNSPKEFELVTSIDEERHAYLHGNLVLGGMYRNGDYCPALSKKTLYNVFNEPVLCTLASCDLDSSDEVFFQHYHQGLCFSSNEGGINRLKFYDGMGFETLCIQDQAEDLSQIRTLESFIQQGLRVQNKQTNSKNSVLTKSLFNGRGKLLKRQTPAAPSSDEPYSSKQSTSMPALEESFHRDVFNRCTKEIIKGRTTDKEYSLRGDLLKRIKPEGNFLVQECLSTTHYQLLKKKPVERYFFNEKRELVCTQNPQDGNRWHFFCGGHSYLELDEFGNRLRELRTNGSLDLIALIDQQDNRWKLRSNQSEVIEASTPNLSESGETLGPSMPFLFQRKGFNQDLVSQVLPFQEVNECFQTVQDAYCYDPKGQVLLSSDFEGHLTHTLRDINGKLLASGEQTSSTDFTYNHYQRSQIFSRLVSRVDKGKGQFHYQYNQLGLLTSLTQSKHNSLPNQLFRRHGSWEAKSGIYFLKEPGKSTPLEHTTYDFVRGELVSVSDIASDTKVCYTYNPLRERISKRANKLSNDELISESRRTLNSNGDPYLEESPEHSFISLHDLSGNIVFRQAKLFCNRGEELVNQAGASYDLGARLNFYNCPVSLSLDSQGAIQSLTVLPPRQQRAVATDTKINVESPFLSQGCRLLYDAKTSLLQREETALQTTDYQYASFLRVNKATFLPLIKKHYAATKEFIWQGLKPFQVNIIDKNHHSTLLYQFKTNQNFVLTDKQDFFRKESWHYSLCPDAETPSQLHIHSTNQEHQSTTNYQYYYQPTETLQQTKIEQRQEEQTSTKQNYYLNGQLYAFDQLKNNPRDYYQRVFTLLTYQGKGLVHQFFRNLAKREKCGNYEVKTLLLGVNDDLQASFLSTWKWILSIEAHRTNHKRREGDSEVVLLKRLPDIDYQQYEKSAEVKAEDYRQNALNNSSLGNPLQLESGNRKIGNLQAMSQGVMLTRQENNLSIKDLNAQIHNQKHQEDLGLNLLFRLSLGRTNTIKSGQSIPYASGPQTYYDLDSESHYQHLLNELNNVYPEPISHQTHNPTNCKEVLTKVATTVAASGMGMQAASLVSGPLTMALTAGLVAGASHASLQGVTKYAHLVNKFSFREVLATAFTTGVGAGFGSYLNQLEPIIGAPRGKLRAIENRLERDLVQAISGNLFEQAAQARHHQPFDFKSLMRSVEKASTESIIGLLEPEQLDGPLEALLEHVKTATTATLLGAAISHHNSATESLLAQIGGQLIGEGLSAESSKLLAHTLHEQTNSQVEPERFKELKNLQSSNSEEAYRLATLKSEGLVATNDELFQKLESQLDESMRHAFGHELEKEFQFHHPLTQTTAESRLHEHTLTSNNDNPARQKKVETFLTKESEKNRDYALQASQTKPLENQSVAENPHGFFYKPLHFDGRGPLKADLLGNNERPHKNREVSPTPTHKSSLLNTTANRAWGLLQMSAGVTELTTALAAAGATEGILSIPSIALGGHALDVITTGWLNLSTGSSKKTFSEQAIVELTGSESTGQLFEYGIEAMSGI